MLRRVHSIAGLVLFAYVLGHLINHSLGVISLDLMEAARPYFMAFWLTWVGTATLGIAAIVHFCLALVITLRRRRLSMPVWQWMQLSLGIAIPLLLAEHLMSTAGGRLGYGLQPTYAYVLTSYWVAGPLWKALLHLALLFVAWGHACIGLGYWLRTKSWWPGVAPWLLAFAVALPVAAAGGYLASARDVIALAKVPGWISALAAGIHYAGAPLEAFVRQATLEMRLTVVAILAALLVARTLHMLILRHGKSIRLTYPDGRIISLPRGGTILEASLAAGVPHASVCGGKARCSTCRVRVGRGGDLLPAASALEAQVLRRISAPPWVRLACQVRPTRDLEVMPLLQPGGDLRSAMREASMKSDGQEMEIAILFADLRGFTKLSEKKLPYDVVFLLNRYFATMGEAITEAGGHIDKFIGDGIMALFGLQSGPEQGARDALKAARAMSVALAELNQSLADDLSEPLAFGIGIHMGHVIVGQMGHSTAVTLTAIGDVVNTASRLESQTKELGVELIVSEVVASRADVSLMHYPAHDVAVRGRTETRAVRSVTKASLLPEIAA